MSEKKQKIPPCSGPVVIPFSDESAAIQSAPAYDVKVAKRYISLMPKVRSWIDGIPADDQLTCFGAFSPSPEAVQRLDTEIQRIINDHHKVSLVMVDLNTRSGVSFHSTVPMCTQSTVKAIYVGALLSIHPEAFRENGQYIRDTVVLSSNEAYESLRDIYGKEPIQATSISFLIILANNKTSLLILLYFLKDVKIENAFSITICFTPYSRVRYVYI